LPGAGRRATITGVDERWREVADRVFVRRHRSFDLNAGLVVGDGACLVVDTRMSHREGRDLVAAVRRITAHPWTVVNTHAHFDHYFGNAVFRPAPIWGHVRCADMIVRYGGVHRAAVVGHAEQDGDEAVLADMAELRIDPPDRTFDEAATLDVGGRPVHLRYLGRGHTDSDIVVQVPDAGVVFAGDLVEQGAPPAFGDGFPLDWPATADRLRAMVPGPVVPGHGDVMDADQVDRQAAEIAQAAAAARASFAAGRTVDQAWPDQPFPERTARDVLIRAYRQLRGDPPYQPPQRWLADLKEL
jgi:glyoxylase-like metal-dependent hydrolase (beta-lactamase superfamily II)